MPATSTIARLRTCLLLAQPVSTRLQQPSRERGDGCVSVRRSRKWSCMHSPPNCTAQFWTGHGLTVGRSPEVGDPCSKWAPNSSKCLGLKSWIIFNKSFEVSISLKGWIKKRDLLLISLRVWDMFILDLFLLEIDLQYKQETNLLSSDSCSTSLEAWTLQWPWRHPDYTQYNILACQPVQDPPLSMLNEFHWLPEII